VLSLALLGLGVWVIAGKSSELSGASVFLSQLRWQWLVAGALVEFGSYVGLAELQRSLLGAGGLRVGLGRALLVIFSGSAIQAALPAGAAFAGVFEFRQYQFLGAEDVLAGFVVVGSAVVAFATLALLAGVGLALAASTGSAFNLAEAILGVVCLTALLIIAWARRDGLFKLVLRVVGWAERVLHRPKGSWTESLDSGAHRLRAVAPGPGTLSRAAAASMSSWLADCMCLAAAFLAVGATVPWQGLLLASCGGQLAVNLPITPGGLGVVEGSLTVALVTFGGGQAATVAAVLLYRVMSFWVPLPVGGATYLALARMRQQANRNAKVAPAVASEDEQPTLATALAAPPRAGGYGRTDAGAEASLAGEEKGA